ncbi:hypothetical protein ENASMM143B3_15645 [Enterobacter asburiae]
MPPALKGCMVIGGKPLSKVATPLLSVVVLESTGMVFFSPLTPKALIIFDGESEEFMSYLLNNINSYPDWGRKCA